MKKFIKLVFCITIIFPLSILGQEKKSIKVIEMNTNEIIFNANLSINRIEYYPSDENGNIHFETMKIKKGDTLYFSCMGYNTMKIEFENVSLLPNEIKLTPAVYQLDEVKVTNKKLKQKEITLGTQTFSISEQFTQANTKYALYINNKEKLKGVIKEIKIHMRNGAKSIDMPFKIRVFNRKLNSKFPGDELMEEVIVQNSKSKTWFTLDISHLNISIPVDGFFIIFQTMPKEYYSSMSRKVHGWTISRVPGLAFTSFPKSVNVENYCLSGLGENKWRILKNMEYQMQAKVLVPKN